MSKYFIKRDQEFVITRGLPRSGKSTYAQKWVRERPEERIRVNRDDLRLAIFGQPVLEFWQEKVITEIQHASVRAALSAGKSVIVDDTNLRQKFLAALVDVARDFPSVNIRFQDFATTVEECIRRDEQCKQQGERWVGEDVILKMANKHLRHGKLPVLPAEFYTNSSPVAVYEEDENLPSAWIFDVDGTLAQMVNRGPYDWDKVSDDEPVHAVINLAKTIKSAGDTIIVMSGRDGVAEPDTRMWLEVFGVPFDELYLREAGNSEKDSIIKKRLFDTHIRGRYYVRGVIDDRNQVVKMWRGMGLTCFQVAEGNF